MLLLESFDDNCAIIDRRIIDYNDFGRRRFLPQQGCETARQQRGMIEIRYNDARAKTQDLIELHTTLSDPARHSD